MSFLTPLQPGNATGNVDPHLQIGEKHSKPQVTWDSNATVVGASAGRASELIVNTPRGRISISQLSLMRTRLLSRPTTFVREFEAPKEIRRPWPPR